MNETIRLLKNRKSVRKYSGEPLPETVKKEIIGAALRAPSAGAMMLYSIIEVTDRPLKDQLAVLCDHQPFIARAPFVLVFLADYQRWMDYFRFCDAEAACAEFGRQPRFPAEGDFLLACMDALIAAQNAVIAAESLSVGSCYIGDIIENYEKIRDLLGLPRWAAPVGMVCFGYPTDDQVSRAPAPRLFDGRAVVHTNRYRRLDGADFTALAAQPEKKANADATNPLARLNPGQHNYIRKFTADFSLEMTRSVKVILKNWQGAPE